MCIIIAKPAGHAVKDKTVKACMTKNKDGAGFAILRDNRVIISKGFFNHKDLLLALSSLEWEKYPCLVHARIATSGTVDMSNCHPFPITRSVAMLAGHYIRTKAAIAHNGTIKWGNVEELEEGSDTMLFVRDVAAPVWETGNTDLWDNLLEHVAAANKCRFATLDTTGMKIYGDGWIEDEGVYYSNSSYRRYQMLYDSKWRRHSGSNAIGTCDNCGGYCVHNYGSNGQMLCYFCGRLRHRRGL